MKQKLSSLLVGAALLSAQQAFAQLGTWRVVAGESASVLVADLPASSRNIVDAAIGDAGRDLYGMRLTSPTASAGYWAFRNTRWRHYAGLNTNGALGPGRSGAESSHVFLSLDSAWGGASVDGQRIFAARAADPAQTQFASYGLWRFDGVSNIELARGSTDGALGPGLGASWVFPNNINFPDARMLAGGRVLIFNEVISPAAATSRYLGMHVPGTGPDSGNRPCMRVGATEAGLSPNLAAGELFANFSTASGRVMVSPGGKVLARLPTSAGREGLFELCNGAPRAIAVTGETGARGPQVGLTGAIFSGFAVYPAQVIREGESFFLANWRVPPNGSREALFRHRGGNNEGVAFNEASGFYGPNALNSTWRDFTSSTLSASGNMAAFVASIDTSEGTTLSGLWRVQAGLRPEPLAILNLTGNFAPEAGRTWRSFETVAVFSNGDVLLQATTNPNAVNELWLFKSGQAPVRVLSNGLVLSVPTAQGNQSATVSSFTILPGGSAFSFGNDDWIGADGSILLRVATPEFGTLLISNRLAVPDPDLVLRSGFE